MVAGLVAGLDHEDAARFSFLLATPIILAAGVYKLGDLLGPNGDGGARPGTRGERRSRDCGLCLCPLPQSLLHPPDAHTVRGLLTRGRGAGAASVRFVGGPEAKMTSGKALLLRARDPDPMAA